MIRTGAKGTRKCQSMPDNWWRSSKAKLYPIVHSSLPHRSHPTTFTDERVPKSTGPPSTHNRGLISSWSVNSPREREREEKRHRNAISQKKYESDGIQDYRTVLNHRIWDEVRSINSICSIIFRALDGHARWYSSIHPIVCADKRIWVVQKYKRDILCMSTNLVGDYSTWRDWQGHSIVNQRAMREKNWPRHSVTSLNNPTALHAPHEVAIFKCNIPFRLHHSPTPNSVSNTYHGFLPGALDARGGGQRRCREDSGMVLSRVPTRKCHFWAITTLKDPGKRLWRCVTT